MIRVLGILLVLSGPALAVQPDEILADAGLEKRAREISSGLRCLVCRNQTIDDSDAGIARDLRLLVRERLVAGDTDREVIAYVVARYGDYVLLSPPAKGMNLLLWAAGPLLLVAGGGIALTTLRRKAPPEPDLSPDEEARLARILKD